MDPKASAEENMEELPEEVSDFIFGDGLEDAINKIGELLDKNQEQKEHIYNDLTFFLLGTESFETVMSYINSLPVTDQKKIDIKKIIQEDIIDELQLLMEVHNELEGKQIPSSVITPSDMLTRLNQTLVKPTMLAPTKRDHSIGEPSIAQAPNETPSIDPYRELPEK